MFNHQRSAARRIGEGAEVASEVVLEEEGLPDTSRGPFGTSLGQPPEGGGVGLADVNYQQPDDWHVFTSYTAEERAKLAEEGESGDCGRREQERSATPAADGLGLLGVEIGLAGSVPSLGAVVAARMASVWRRG